MPLPPTAAIVVERTLDDLIHGTYLPEPRLMVTRRCAVRVTAPSWPLTVLLQLVAEDGRVLVTEVSVRGAEGLTSDVLRSIPLAHVVRRALDQVAVPARWERGRLVAEVFGPSGKPLPSGAIQRALEPRPPRSRQHHRALLETVVNEYRQAVAAGVAHPRKHVAQRLGYSSTYVGKLLHEARTMVQPLLGKAPGPGKAGEIPKEET